MDKMFRLLRADEIDARISTCNQYGVGLLLYKNARCDQNILDETVGEYNWQRRHTRDNANCIVSIWDEQKQQWIEKEDTGTESYTEKEKGLASDSFKRACFNWGIGRELYTAPNMFVFQRDLKTLKEYNGKWTCRDSFDVAKIEHNDRNEICYVQIYNRNTKGYIEFGTPADAQKKQEAIANGKISKLEVIALEERCKSSTVNKEQLKALYKVNSISDLTEKQHKNIIDNWVKVKEVCK